MTKTLTPETDTLAFSWLCAVEAGTDETSCLMIDGHTISTERYLAITRMNNLLATEVGLLSAAYEADFDEVLSVLIGALAQRLLTRTPQETLRQTAGSTFKRYRGDYPHQLLGRGMIRTLPNLPTPIATLEQAVVVNLLGRLPENSDYWLLMLSESITNLLFYADVSWQELSAILTLTEQPTYTDNVVAFGTPRETTDV